MNRPSAAIERIFRVNVFGVDARLIVALTAAVSDSPVSSMIVLGTARAQYQLRQTLVFLDGRPVNKPEVMIGAAQTKFADGKFNDETGAKLMTDLGAALVLAVRQHRAHAHVK